MNSYDNLKATSESLSSDALSTIESDSQSNPADRFIEESPAELDRSPECNIGNDTEVNILSIESPLDSADSFAASSSETAANATTAESSFSDINDRETKFVTNDEPGEAAALESPSGTAIHRPSNGSSNGITTEKSRSRSAPRPSNGGVANAVRPSRPRSGKNAQKAIVPGALAPGGNSPRPKKLRNLNTEESFELLIQARQADQIQLFLRDARVIEGAILFNDIKGTGRIINVLKEISVDFRATEVRDIRF
ncbi:MAG: hypothetical protein ACKVS6_00015 [Planctomycetota bacterium]